MIKNVKLLETFEKEYIEQDKSDYFSNLVIFEGMYDEARSFGVLPLEDPLEGLDVKIRMARNLNVSTNS